MIGRGHEELEDSYTGAIALDSRPEAPVVLDVRGLGAGRAFADVSLDVRAGEVLGIYGFMGCGLIELARTLFGKLQRRRRHHVDRRQVAAAAQHRRGAAAPASPSCRRAAGRCCSTPSRSTRTCRSACWAASAALLLRPSVEKDIARRHVQSLSIRPPTVETLLGSLSGGNQQKVALAKWLTWPPKVLVLSEPTRGMDVGAKEDVVRIVKGLRDQGMGVVVLSTEPETVLSLADRIVVMKKGRIVREFAGETVSKDQLLEAA